MEKERKKRTPFEKLKPFTDAQRSLMAEWYPWAMKYAVTEINRRIEKNDMTPASVIRDAAVNALIYASCRWDSQMGVSFKTFYHKGFYSCVWNAVKEYSETNRSHISENSPLFDDSEDINSDIPRLKDTNLFSGESFEDAVCDKVDIEMILSKLTPLQAESLRRVYMYGERQSDIARSIGTARQNVNQAVSSAARYFKMIYNGECDRVQRGRKKKSAGTEN